MLPEGLRGVVRVNCFALFSHNMSLFIGFVLLIVNSIESVLYYLHRKAMKVHVLSNRTQYNDARGPGGGHDIKQYIMVRIRWNDQIVYAATFTVLICTD